MIQNIFELLNNTLGNNYFLIGVETASLFLKLGILVAVILNGLRAPKIPRPWFYLIPVLIGSMFSNLAWVASLTKKIFFPEIDYRPILFLVRIGWACAIILYQSLALLLESLTNPDFFIKKLYQKIFIGISAVLCLCFWYLAFFKFNTAHNRPPYEFQLFNISSKYMFIIIIPALLLAIKRIRSSSIPKILKKQLKILIQGIILPSVLSDFIQLYPFSFFPNYMASNYAVVSISSALITFGLFYSAKRIMGLRFLNFQGHVQSTTKFNFIDDFKATLENLSHATSIKELNHVTQTFFKNAFDIHPSKVTLYVRTLDANKASTNEVNLYDITTSVENFITRHDIKTCKIMPTLRQQKIVIYDETAFSNFYQESKESGQLLEFLEQINADVFLPIFQKQTVIAYVIVQREARADRLYSNVEHDEMVVFTSYLSNIINLLQSQDINALIKNKKDLEEELFKKHQEITQYKESIRTFAHDTRQQKIGVLFYKNRRFVYGNQAAKELLEININLQEGHPYTKTLKNIAQQVEDYGAPARAIIKDHQGYKLVFSAIPNLEKNNVIIIVHYAKVFDIVKQQIDMLRNPSEWDYLLYLETTKSGQLINQLIPGSGQELLNFKIDLLKIALTKKALLLEMPEEDLMATVKILHHISLRQTMHVLNLQSPVSGSETAIKLFGMNPLFGGNNEEPLLKKLHTIGTLFIQNIHYLDIESQNHLAEFISHGYFHMYRSEQKITSKVRIICSTNKNLQTLVQEGKFSKTLFTELKKTTITMPSLLTLSHKEINTLADGLAEQALATQDLKNLLELTEKEKHKLTSNRPVSLQEFKEKIEQLLINKSKKNEIYQETHFDPAYHVSDPDLVQAARLGKKALKDPKLMEMLWHKFKNQNKIANLLGVNRSSINRRLQAYNLR